MNWTREKPTQAGVYWLCRDGIEAPGVAVVEVRGQRVRFIGTDCTGGLHQYGAGYLWAGPLVPPQGEEE